VDRRGREAPFVPVNACIRYEITKHGKRWEFRPSSEIVSFLVACWAGGIALFVYLACLTESFFRIIFLLIAGLLAGGVVWALWTRRTPLTVEPGGSVCYGGAELCAAGAVRAVRVAGARSGESGDCEVCLEVGERKLVYLPATSLYFGSFKRREDAYPFAEKLAAALAVEVTESA
jgi:hypothetical protein